MSNLCRGFAVPPPAKDNALGVATAAFLRRTGSLRNYQAKGLNPSIIDVLAAGVGWRRSPRFCNLTLRQGRLSVGVREFLKESETVVGAVRDCRRLMASLRAAERRAVERSDPASISRQYLATFRRKKRGADCCAGRGEPQCFLHDRTWMSIRWFRRPSIRSHR